MNTPEEKKSTPSNGTARLDRETKKHKIIEEIERILEIPEIHDYFYRAVLEARHIFKDKIEDYRHQEVKNKTGEKKGEEVPDHPHSLKRSKTYSFEMNKVEDPGSDTGFMWILEKCKFPTDEEAIQMVFNDFMKVVDEYEVAPHRIQVELVEFPPQGKIFHIRFTKSSSTRVIGFMKEVQEIVIEEKEKK